ncbi:MAG TPA: nucleoside hydrolase, partial [Bacillota bacterium]|nr:nucleoside hydrolase [Bacillota bacterium]
MKHGIICALIVWLFAAAITTAGQGTEPRGTAAHPARIPVIYCTDLFHPYDDPDDHFDLATIYAMPELDLKGIVLDQGEKQLQKPGKTPVSQMNQLTGRNVPAVPGLAHKLKSPSDQALDQAGFQQGVQFILDTLKQSSVPVMIAAVGSVRDIAAAFNRDPALFRAKVGKVLVFIGEASEPKYREYNVELDPHAYIGLMRSGLPIYWVPCFDGGVWQNRDHASFWQARHADLLQGAAPGLIQCFIYALEQEKADPLAFLAQPPAPERQKRLLAGTRNLWCTAIFGVLADKTAAFDGSRYLLVPVREVNSENSPHLE